MTRVLVDASVWAAVFDDSDAHRQVNVEKLTTCHEMNMGLITTSPCVTEASHLLSPQNHFGLLTWL